MSNPTLSLKLRLILAIEAAIRGGSISLLKENEIIGSWHGETDVSRAEDLLYNISELLEQTKIERTDLDLIAVSNGPGSYTGIRIGLATALGLGNALQIECFGLPLLNAVDAAYAVSDNRLVAVPIGRAEVCWQAFPSVYKFSPVATGPRAGTVLNLLEELKTLPDFRLIVHHHLFTILSGMDDFASFGGRVVDFGQNLSASIGAAAQNPNFASEMKPFYIHNPRFSP